jgi:hypothetical protein
MGKCKNTTYYSIDILHTGMTELVAKHVQVIEKQSIFMKDKTLQLSKWVTRIEFSNFYI